MTIITELHIPSADFVLERTMAAVPNAAFQLEQFVPTGGDRLPYVWVHDGGKPLEEVVVDDPDVEEIRLVESMSEGTLFTVVWADIETGLLGGLKTDGSAMLQAVGQDQQWFLKLRFTDRDALSEFQSYCDQSDIDFTLGRLYEMDVPKLGQFDLTKRQRDALIMALQMGYFEIPRDCELADVADELDLSPNAVSERLRRGEANLLRSALTIHKPPTLGGPGPS